MDYPLQVYRFLRDDVGTQFIQFIPIVELDKQAGSAAKLVSNRSVSGEQYGAFLIAVFDEWVRRDVGRVYVQIFDVALATWIGAAPGLRIFEQTCGKALAGGCPKDRILLTPDGEPGLHCLCAGYKSFFTHIDAPMRWMAAELQAGCPPAGIMHYLAEEEKELQRRFARAGRNDPCPCGSGRKFKQCHG